MYDRNEKNRVAKENKFNYSPIKSYYVHIMKLLPKAQFCVRISKSAVTPRERIQQHLLSLIPQPGCFDC
uniref:Uncharacterized protein n=1 Tax=Arundo donax TaxID=35708 RepID=A0A0A9A3C0_ARUDO